MEIKTEALQRGHLERVVSVHGEAFPGFFLSFLGPAFLAEFYRSFYEDELGIGFVALNASGKVCGVVVGPLRPDGYFRRLLMRRWWAFALASLGAVLRKPSVAPRLFRAVFYRGDAPSGPPRSLLSSLAVDPGVQGQGVGRKLVEAWLAEVKRRGSAGAFLTTDADGNDGVNAFYQRLGWRLTDTFATPEGRRMSRYAFDFPATASG